MQKRLVTSLIVWALVSAGCDSDDTLSKDDRSTRAKPWAEVMQIRLPPPQQGVSPTGGRADIRRPSRKAIASALREQVEEAVERAYRHPDLHSVFLAPDDGSEHRADLVVWARKFDGVDMATNVSSVLNRDGITWETRWIRELKEPEPVRREALVPIGRIVDVHGLAGNEPTRLLYRPLFEADPNAQSWETERWVKEYRLVREFDTPDFYLLVDPYTGLRLSRGSKDIR